MEWNGNSFVRIVVVRRDLTCEKFLAMMYACIRFPHRDDDEDEEEEEDIDRQREMK